MREVLNELTAEQIQFICQECSITKDELLKLDEDQLYDQVYDKMCDIEIAETPSNDEELSEHCAMAADIVTLLGNTLAAEEYPEKLVLHIPHFAYDGTLREVDYKAFIRHLAAELEKIGVKGFYTVPATAYYNGREYAEELLTVFCTILMDDEVEDVFEQAYREHNDIMQQESFAYERDGELKFIKLD